MNTGNFKFELFPEEFSSEDLNSLKRILKDYLKAVDKIMDGNLCTCFADYEGQLEKLPGKYSKKYGGAIIVLRESKSNEICGCVLLNKESEENVEMTKLFVSTNHQKKGLGRKIVSKLIEHSISMGYKNVVLATNPRHSDAIRLYKKFGFKEWEEGYDAGCDLKTVICYKLSLEK